MNARQKKAPIAANNQGRKPQISSFHYRTGYPVFHPDFLQFSASFDKTEQSGVNHASF